MFATRTDQENLTHNHQQAAAAKPLNQGLKGYGAKTPAPKTPFRIPLNDENAVGAGKTGLKTNGKGKEGGLGGKKGGEVEGNAFVTPAGPRNRAPLGMKTTNAKAKAFQTPAPLTIDNKIEKSAQRTVSPRLRRAKVKVHQPEPLAQEANIEREPEIEHVPPKEVPLADYPESDVESESYFGPNKQYPMFEGENATRGIYDAYIDPIDEHGERASEKRDRLAQEKYEAKQEKMIDEQMEKERLKEETRMRAELGMSPPKSKAAAPPPAAAQMLVKASKIKTPSSTAGTIPSRSAAAALSAPTKSSLARQQVSTPLAPKPKGLMNAKVRDPLPSKTSNTKNGTGIAASKSTVGYSKGRAMSSTMRNISANKTPTSRFAAKGDQENARPALSKKITDPVPSLASLGLDDGDLDDDLGGRPPLFEEEEEELFQFKLDG